MKNLYLLLALTVLPAIASAPVDSLEFDKLDTDLADLKYEVEEEDLDDFSKLLDEKAANNQGDTSGYTKKTASNQGSKRKHNIGDLKKFFKTEKAYDNGSNDDDEIYAQAEGYRGSAFGVQGNEKRKFRKGTKTRGFHRVHHQDEYKKDKQFYEDDETSGVINKIGAKGSGLKLKAGAGFNQGRFHHDRQKGLFGSRGFADRGFADKAFAEYSEEN